MSRLGGLFAHQHRTGRCLLVGYLVAGDPSPEATVPAMQALAAGGVDIIELGMAFSDPEADGPDIQAGHSRALAAGVRLPQVFAAARAFRMANADTGIVLMGYYNVVERLGVDCFVQQAAAAGVDGLLFVNLPPEEALELRDACQRYDLDLIPLIAPTTTQERARLILDTASGFAYYVSLKGTTGAGHLDVAAVRERLLELRELTELPLAVGFGIHDAVSAATLARFADAVVVGSALVRRMGEGSGDLAALPAQLSAFAGELRQAMDAHN